MKREVTGEGWNERGEIRERRKTTEYGNWKEEKRGDGR